MPVSRTRAKTRGRKGSTTARTLARRASRSEGRLFSSDSIRSRISPIRGLQAVEREVHQLGLEPADLLDEGSEGLHVAVVLRPEDLGECLVDDHLSSMGAPRGREPEILAEGRRRPPAASRTRSEGVQDVVEGVYRPAADLDLVVKVRTRRAARGADDADEVAPADALALGDPCRLEVRVERPDSEAVGDLDDPAVAVAPPDPNDGAVGGGDDLSARRRGDVDSGVELLRSRERVRAEPEAGRQDADGGGEGRSEGELIGLEGELLLDRSEAAGQEDTPAGRLFEDRLQCGWSCPPAWS